MRAGLLGAVVAVDGGFEAQWTDAAGAKSTERFPKEGQAVQHVSRNQALGLHYLDRHSVSLLSDGGVPIEQIARLIGHTGGST